MNVPASAGLPVIWWLFWFAAALALYYVLFRAIFGAARRVDADMFAELEQGHKQAGGG